MREADVQRWAHEVIARCRARQPTEDQRVEIKSRWPEGEDAARQLAGCANAARSAEVLWLIGLAEVSGEVIGAGPLELANWLQSARLIDKADCLAAAQREQRNQDGTEHGWLSKLHAEQV